MGYFLIDAGSTGAISATVDDRFKRAEYVSSGELKEFGLFGAADVDGEGAGETLCGVSMSDFALSIPDTLPIPIGDTDSIGVAGGIPERWKESTGASGNRASTYCIGWLNDRPGTSVSFGFWEPVDDVVEYLVQFNDLVEGPISQKTLWQRTANPIGEIQRPYSHWMEIGSDDRVFVAHATSDAEGYYLGTKTACVTTDGAQWIVDHDPRWGGDRHLLRDINLTNDGFVAVLMERRYDNGDDPWYLGQLDLYDPASGTVMLTAPVLSDASVSGSYLWRSVHDPEHDVIWVLASSIADDGYTFDFVYEVYRSNLQRAAAGRITAPTKPFMSENVFGAACGGNGDVYFSGVALPDVDSEVDAFIMRLDFDGSDASVNYVNTLDAVDLTALDSGIFVSGETAEYMIGDLAVNRFGGADDVVMPGSVWWSETSREYQVALRVKKDTGLPDLVSSTRWPGGYVVSYFGEIAGRLLAADIDENGGVVLGGTRAFYDTVEGYSGEASITRRPLNSLESPSERWDVSLPGASDASGRTSMTRSVASTSIAGYLYHVAGGTERTGATSLEYLNWNGLWSYDLPIAVPGGGGERLESLRVTAGRRPVVKHAFTLGNGGTIDVFGTAGRLVRTVAFGPDDEYTVLDELPVGVYFLRLEAKEGRSVGKAIATP